MIRPGLLSVSLLVVACGEKTPEPPPVVAELAAQSLDAMTEYQRKSKASEARVRIKMIAESARRLMTEERVGADGQLAPPGPPDAAPMTPPEGACCKTQDKKCAPTPTDWQHPSWQALSFEIADPHYYSYALEPTADGFVAKAVGDLDCDGTFARYELRGTSKNGEVLLEDVTSTEPLE